MSYIRKKFSNLKTRIIDALSFSVPIDEIFGNDDQLSKDILNDLRYFDRVSINLEKKEKLESELKRPKKLYIVK